MVLNKKLVSIALVSIFIINLFSYFPIPDANALQATGGTITHSGGKTIHTFTSNGTFTVTKGSGNIQILIVAGGGGGGSTQKGSTFNRAGGGGGAGGYIYNSSYAVSPQSYTVTVGSGGAGGTNATGSNGKNSIFGSLTAIGGGGGAGSSGDPTGNNGGSGGGSASSSSNQGNGTAGQGNNGGKGNGSGGAPSARAGGGGGGASTAGQTAPSVSQSGKGGNGTANAINGTSITYAGGGGGGGAVSVSSAVGGLGGGGNGKNSTNGDAGTNGLGGGGGGTNGHHTGGNGGSGIVIISYNTFSIGTPTLNKAVTLNTTAINMTWTSVSGATWYSVNMSSPVGGTFSQIINTTALKYLKTGLTPGTQYAFKVAAGNSSGIGNYSNIKSNYTINIAPTALTSSSVTNTTARISWTNPSGNFSGFKIERESPVGGGWSTIVSNTLNATNHRDYSGLNGNTQYNTRISTNYATGSNYSGTSSPSVAYAFYTLPFTPTSLNVTEPINMTLQLKWTAGTDNGTALGYKIDRKTNSGSFSTLVSNTGNTLTNYNDSSVSVGNTYSYRVYAIKTGGTSGASHIATSGKVWQTVRVSAYHSDNSTTTYGAILQTNSTARNIVFPLYSGIANVTGTTGNQNFSARNDLVNFVVKKQYNFNSTALHSLRLITNDFYVDCPYTGTGTDIELWTNATDGHRISNFTTPTCYANNTVKWQTKFTANGNSPVSYNTAVDVKVIDPTFMANATLKANSTKIPILLSDPYLISNQFTVGTGYQTRVLNWSMNLTVASGFIPVNYTIGHININGTNHYTSPITFNSTATNSTFTTVSVIYPNTYNMAFGIYLANTHQNLTYTGLPATNFSPTQLKTNISFKNPANDTITINAKDLISNNYATDILTGATSSIPMIAQIQSFKSGAFGTTANFGGIDLITFIVIIISMIGMNRVNETIGVLFSFFVIGVAASFSLITFPTIMLAAIATTIMVTVASTRKLPWS